MAKKRTMKKQIFTFRREYIIWALILMLILLQAASIWHIQKLQEQANHNSELSMKYILKNAEEDRYKYPVIDIAENKVYIPEARIYLPLNEVSRDLRYDYRVQGGVNKTPVLYFSTSSVVGQQNNAQYASCDKMVTLTSPSTQKVVVGNSIDRIQPTKDGLSEIHTYTEESCWNQKWYGDLQQDLLEAVQTIKNY